jgi:adenylyl-sulfate reductase (glutathione)
MDFLHGGDGGCGEQVAKFQADGDNKPYAKQYLQLESFPTILFFPANSSSVVKYQSEDREANALLGFVHSFNR